MNEAELGLHDLLLQRLLDDEAATDEISSLVLAAWAGETELAEAALGKPYAPSDPAEQPDAAHPDVYLAAVHAEGFRGIGAPAMLPLRPGPGLTLVTGRNGSGKSSFAEAAELVLTGSSERWRGRTTVWRDGWRNLHYQGSTSIAVDLITAGTTGTTRIERRWAPEDGLSGGSWTRQEPGAKRVDFDDSPWGEAMETYRPFLSYSELGALIDGRPSDLYDAVHSLLGLGALTAAQNRLKAARKQLADRARAANSERKAIREELTPGVDPRIDEALALLKSTAPDLEKIAALIAGTDDSGEDVAGIRAILALRLPEPDVVNAATTRIRQLADAQAKAATSEVSTADRLAQILREALRYHSQSDSATCPVCEQGILDDAWRAHTSTRADELERSAAEMRRASADLDRATIDARSLIQTTPPAVDGHLREAWEVWAAAGQVDGPVALAQALGTAHPAVVDALSTAQTEAEQKLAQRDEIWAPVARRLGAYHDSARQVAANTDHLADLDKAEKWLAATAGQLREQRLAPFAEQSKRVWQSLRQQSSVELGSVRLDGAATRRRVAMDVRIDGVDGGTALGVMSQGELHALGLSLFLPRATVDQSPFRFVLIDDPVQAMDPAKVDGLARVLAETAERRQIVVFTHDDRLADAVRRLELSATIWEVARGERSVVELRRSDDPIARYLDDARAMALTEALPPDIRSELVASCCRSAVEAACHAKIRAVRLTAGYTHAEVEAALAEATTTSKKATLAVFDDPTRGGDLLGRIRSAGPGTVDAFQKCKKGAHKGLTGDLRSFVKDVETLAAWLQR